MRSTVKESAKVTVKKPRVRAKSRAVKPRSVAKAKAVRKPAAKSAKSAAAKKKEPDYENIEVEFGGNVVEDLIKLGKAFGGIKLDLPDRRKNLTMKSNARKSAAKPAKRVAAKKKNGAKRVAKKKKEPDYENIKIEFDPNDNIAQDFLKIGKAFGGFELDLPYPRRRARNRG